ncbi:Bardet-Biedl syndrome 12 protein [Sorex araneus]|uniref:Bardet-Biedl syndrome 12 protein n=1 Tax=Sorex araneus TaxID=42254 RepID=UPI002433842D|nr:Bardet-Biedl syndrome 12 protein [Sorex araneus]XP_055000893.1 Bardet-Biedl syndrome 12 protein [Sorex araneus]
MTARGHGGVVDPRQHRGLQELSSLAEKGQTLLGPVRASKFIVGDGGRESELVRSARRLLGALDLSSAAGQLLREAVEAQHGTHHAGTSTLLLLVGAWSRAAQECLQLGVPSPVLVAAMSEGLSACLRAVTALQVPLHGLPSRGPFLQDETRGPGAAGPQQTTARPPETPVEPRPTTRAQAAAGEGRPLAETRPRPLALTHSRHFARARGLPREQDATIPRTLPREGPPEAAWVPGAGPGVPCCEGPAGLAELEAGLSHGDPGSMQLVGVVARWQWRSARAQPGSSLDSCSLDLSRVFTCCFPGFPESSSCVCPGLVMAVPSSHMALVAALQAQPVRVVLLEGDLSASYRHPGLRGPVCPVVASVEGPQASPGELWLERVLQVLAQFSVNLVLARGRVCPQLRERCMHSGCLALGSVSGRAMQALAEASGAVPLAYVTQLEEHCVGTGLRVAVGEGLPREAAERTGRAAITLWAEGSPLVTAVLASPVAAQLPAREDGFWVCAHRLSQALRDGRVFLGGGAVELLCLCQLHTLAGTPPGGEGQARPPWLASALALHRPTVLQGLSRGWDRYLCALSVNSARHATELDASTCTQGWVQQALASGSPAAYVMRMWEQLGFGAVGVGRALRAYDVVTPKVEAWRRALDLVLLVLQTDCEVITGLEPTQISSQDSGELLFL